MTVEDLLRHTSDIVYEPQLGHHGLARWKDDIACSEHCWRIPGSTSFCCVSIAIWRQARDAPDVGAAAESDWAAVHRELRRKQVTLSIRSEEYIAGERGDFFSGRSFGNGL